MNRQLHEYRIGPSRLSNRLVSPRDLSSISGQDNVVIVHPGRQKKPETLIPLLNKLANEGFLPIGADTRFGEPDRNLASSYFNSQELGRFPEDFYRRPAALLAMCERLGIEQASFIGHSEGAQVGVMAANADTPPIDFNTMLLVNGVGIGTLATKQNKSKSKNKADANFQGAEKSELVLSGIDSAWSALTMPGQNYREIANIRHFDAWECGAIDVAKSICKKLVLLHAIDDRVIDGADVEERATESDTEYLLTTGGHSNIYSRSIQQLIVKTLTD